MTAIYVLTGIILAAVAGLAVAVLYLIKKVSSSDNLTVRDVREESAVTVNEIKNAVGMSGAMLTGTVNALDQSVKTQTQATTVITQRFDSFMGNVDIKLEKMREDSAKNLNEVKEENLKALAEVRDGNAKAIDVLRKENETQLEKMRATVDEKLASTLEQRFNQSFEIVSKRLEEINRGFAELQNLQTGVNDLKGIFRNIKTRGTWGEVALETLLSQILTDSQFERQYNLSRTGNEPVDIVIKLPGKGEGEVFLPIDAKFPLEDYQRLVEASEKADAEGVDVYGKAVEQRIKKEAQSIRDKYIKPPLTTDFAVMYLPVEGLYAEVVKRSGLIEKLQNDYRVVVCGPTTLAALLNSLQMGFRSVAIEKRSTEIGKLLSAFIKDFGDFSNLLQKTSKTLETVQNTISKGIKRSDIIRKKLNKVGQFAEKTDNDNFELTGRSETDENDDIIVDTDFDTEDGDES